MFIFYGFLSLLFEVIHISHQRSQYFYELFILKNIERF